jgi:hypothetical protein
MELSLAAQENYGQIGNPPVIGFCSTRPPLRRTAGSPHFEADANGSSGQRMWLCALRSDGALAWYLADVSIGVLFCHAFDLNRAERDRPVLRGAQRVSDETPHTQAPARACVTVRPDGTRNGSLEEQKLS